MATRKVPKKSLFSRKSRKLERSLSAAVIASAMMAGSVSAQYTINVGGPYSYNDYTTNVAPNPSVTIDLGQGNSLYRDAFGPNFYIGASSFNLYSGIVDEINLTEGFWSTVPATLTVNSGLETGLNGTHTYTGATSITDGRLTLGNGTSKNGVLGNTSAITIGQNGILRINNVSGNFTGATNGTVTNNGLFVSEVGAGNSVGIAAEISGDGDFQKDGAGTTTIQSNGDVEVAEARINNGALIVEGRLAADIIQVGSTGNTTTFSVRGGATEGQVNLTNGTDFDLNSTGTAATHTGNVNGYGAGTNVNLTGLGANQAEIDGSVDLEDGNVTLSLGTITGSVTTDNGDVSLNNTSFVGGNVTTADGDVTLDNDSTVEGNINAEGNVKIHGASTVGTEFTGGIINVDADGIVVEVRDDSTVNGGIDVDGVNNLVDIDGSNIFGSIDVTGADSNVDATGSNITGVISTEGANGTVKLVGTSAGGIYTTGDGSHVEVLANSIVNGNVATNGTNSHVNVNSDSAISGNVEVQHGYVDLDGHDIATTATVGGNIRVHEGYVTLDDSAIVLGNVHITDGNAIAGQSGLSLNSASRIEGSVLIEEGDLRLSNVSWINGGASNSVQVLDGDVDVLSRSAILANLTVNNGYVNVQGDNSPGNTPGDRSRVQGNIDAGNGNVSVHDNAEVDGNIIARNGTVLVEDRGYVTGSVTTTGANGNVTVDTASEVRSGVSILNGNLLVRGGSAVWNGAGLGANVGNGNVDVENASYIANGVQIANGNAKVNTNAYVTGGIRVTGAGNVDVNNGRVEGTINVNNGRVTVLDSNSSVAPLRSVDRIEVQTGSVDINNGLVEGGIRLGASNVVGAGVAITNGSNVLGGTNIGVEVSSGDVLIDDSDVSGGFDGVNNLLGLRITNGSALVDNGGTVDGGVNITTGDLTLDRNAVVTDGVEISTGDLSLDNDSIVDGGVAVTTGNVSANKASIIRNGAIGIGTGNLALTLGSTVDNANIAVLNGNVTAETLSSILGSNVGVANGHVALSTGSRIDGNGVDIVVRVLEGVGNNGNAVSVETGSSIVGDVIVDHGNVLVQYLDSRITGDIDILRGNLNLNDLGHVTGNVDVAFGNVTLTGLSTIDGSVEIEEVGNVSLNRSQISNGSVTVNEGDILVDAESTIASPFDVVSTQRGNIIVNARSSINADAISITNRGNLVVNDNSRVIGLVTIQEGINDGGVDVNDKSAIEGDVNVVQGNVTVDNESEIDGNVDVDEGSVLVDNDSAIFGDVSVGLGNVLVNHDSLIDGNDVWVGVGDVIVDNSSELNADVDVDEGNVIVDHQSAILGSVSVDLGSILVDNDSLIDGATVHTLEGDISVLNESEIDADVTIHEGLLTVDATSAITGRVDVNGLAIADVEGVINGDVFLNHATPTTWGGVFRGVNPLVNGDFINNGTLTPGNALEPVGTLRVTGDYVQQADGNLIVDIFSRAHHDRVLVDGTATIDGNLYLTNHGYRHYRRGKFNLIVAAGGVIVNDKFEVNYGNFHRNTMLRPVVRYRPNAVVLDIQQQKFHALKGLTHNERQVARALDYAAKKNQLDRLFGYLNYTDVSNVPALLSRLSPEELTAIFKISQASSQIQNVNIERRLEDVRAGSYGFSDNGLALSNANGAALVSDATAVNTKDGLTLAGWDGKSIVSKEVVAPVIEQARWGFFATGSGEWARIRNTSESRGQEFTSAGVTIGADYRVSENFVVGINAGYTNTQSDLSWDGSIDVNSGRGGVYATVYGGGAYLNAALGGGYNSYKTERGTLGGKATGDSDGGELNALLGGGYDFRTGGLAIGPVGSVQYTYTGLGGFTETGSAAALHFNDQHQQSLRTTVGLKASYAWNLGNVVFRPEVRAQWKHEFLDNTPSIAARFDGADKYFSVNGPAVGRDSLLLDAGASVEINSNFSVFAYYTGELGATNYDSHSVNGGFRVAF